jgi:hypothetical protein
MRRLALVLLLSSIILTGDHAEAQQRRSNRVSRRVPAKATTIADAWLALPRIKGHGCGDDLVFDYGSDGGMRNFFCRALTVFSWKTLLSLAPVLPFRAGPHAEGKLNLSSEKDFGRYDPRFVRWATSALIPAADDPRLRADTQRIYERHARSLARTYYRVWRAISSEPGWVEAEVRFYLGAADRGEVAALGRALDLYHDVLGSAEQDWGGHDPNHVRSATAWWLRRSHDNTAELWQEGLERLLKTYDATWLASEQRSSPHRPPWRKRAHKPEYR